jgi:UDP-GlcNAc:undecaprenyl-phosphate GlcNAc-1-phosphate transferase
VIEFADLGRGIVAACLTFACLWLLLPVAHRLKLLDVPTGRKDHALPTPVIGGVAMAAGILVTIWCTTIAGAPLLAYALGGGLLIVVGLLDDRYDLPWWLRICVQVVAALVMTHLGGVRVEHLGRVFGLGDTSLGTLSVPFTVFATVGLINAINMIDGADGIAGSLVLAALVMLYAAGLYSGNAGVAEQTIIMAGGVAGFLWLNLRFPWRTRAAVFMGNAGSAFLGFTIAWVAFRLTQNPGHPVTPILALWLVPIPVMDCLVLMARRIRRGTSPFKADHGHIHHLLRGAGFTPMQKVLMLCGFSSLCGLMAGQALRWDVPHPLLLIAFFAMCGGWYWLTSRRERATGFFRRLHGFWLLPPVAGGHRTGDLAARGEIGPEAGQET